MDIIISGDSTIPLYEQIMRQLKEQILQGKLAQGSILPSIRVLAKELKVSIITIKRTYEELEREGFVEILPGKGTYVSMNNRERLREIRTSQIEEKLEEVVSSAKNIGISLEDIIECITLIYDEA